AGRASTSLPNSPAQVLVAASDSMLRSANVRLQPGDILLVVRTACPRHGSVQSADKLVEMRAEIRLCRGLEEGRPQLRIARTGVVIDRRWIPRFGFEEALRCVEKALRELISLTTALHVLQRA